MKYFKLLIVFLCLGNIQASAQIHLGKIFTDSMILQRNQPLKLWGWSKPGEKITLSFNAKKYSAVTNADSLFTIKIPKQKAGGPYELCFSANGKIKRLSDVYFGDIWFCSGQSNMEFKLSSTDNASTEIPEANFPLIRQFAVGKAGADAPLKDVVSGNWTVCTPQNAGNFSAVAYFFSKEIQKRTKVPIGIIYSVWGGSDILAWMDKIKVQEFPAAEKMTAAVYDGFLKQEKVRLKKIFQDYSENFFRLNNNLNADGSLINNDFFDQVGWKSLNVPGTFQSQNIALKKGYVWMRKEVCLTEAFIQGSIRLELDRIRDAEVTFVNGVRIGSTIVAGYQRGYDIPKGLLKQGCNEILICCYNENGESGFSGVYVPKFKNGINKEFEINGQWQYKQGLVTDKAFMLGRLEPQDIERKYPTLIHNAMVAPLYRFGVKGFLWYQGEQNANANQVWSYDKMLANLITSWRNSFNQKKASFFIVQLPNFGKVEDLPKPHPWAILREQQEKIADILPNVFCATTIDIGNPIDIHPGNKKDVGQRLALLARKHIYGDKKLIAKGPTFNSLYIDGNKVFISFSNIGSGLSTNNNEDTLTAFSIAGNDCVYYRAVAKIEGNKVVVFSDKVANPVSVRYAFEASPPKVNFCNKEGLPAVPFRTDRGKIEKF